MAVSAADIDPPNGLRLSRGGEPCHEGALFRASTGAKRMRTVTALSKDEPAHHYPLHLDRRQGASRAIDEIEVARAPHRWVALSDRVPGEEPHAGAGHPIGQ